VGNIRKLNEDSFLELPEKGLWVVADGMGGHAGGDLASLLIVNALSQMQAPESLSAAVDEFEKTMLSVHERLRALSEENQQTMGSTVVALLVRGSHCVILWVGDSRLYRLRDGRLEQLTTDHSQVELYINQGLIRREDAQTHPAANMITRAIGASDDLVIDMDMEEIWPYDRFLLCSDGLDRHLSDSEIAKLMCIGEPEEVAKRLIDTTLARGATDNVTVSVVDILTRNEMDMRKRVDSRSHNYKFIVDPDPTEPLAAS
jgi:serine/threonine protein phosphatase PrpC